MKTTNKPVINLKDDLFNYLKKYYIPEDFEYGISSFISMDLDESFCEKAIQENVKYQKPFVDVLPFNKELFRLIDESGLSDVELYKKADVDRRLFSKIRSEEYTPSKETVFRFILALNLDIYKAKTLLEFAGFAFSRSSKFDLIVRYCIERQKYDLIDVNALLYENTGKIL